VIKCISFAHLKKIVFFFFLTMNVHTTLESRFFLCTILLMFDVIQKFFQTKNQQLSLLCICKRLTASVLLKKKILNQYKYGWL
jgi:hypothetical protein